MRRGKAGRGERRGGEGSGEERRGRREAIAPRRAAALIRPCFRWRTATKRRPRCSSSSPPREPVGGRGPQGGTRSRGGGGGCAQCQHCELRDPGSVRFGRQLGGEVSPRVRGRALKKAGRHRIVQLEAQWLADDHFLSLDGEIVENLDQMSWRAASFFKRDLREAVKLVIPGQERGQLGRRDDLFVVRLRLTREDRGKKGKWGSPLM